MLYEIGGYLTSIYDNADKLETLETPENYQDADAVERCIQGFKTLEPVSNGLYQESILHQARGVLDELKGYFEDSEDFGELRTLKYEKTGESENPWEDGILKVTYELNVELDPVFGFQVSDATVEVPFRLLPGEKGGIVPVAAYRLAPQTEDE